MYINKCTFIKSIVVLILIISGIWQFGSGSYIYAKAQLAQILLNNAWSKTLQGDQKAKPWSWADTYPIGKITFNKVQKNYIVLEGGSGRTMAFGPGHVSKTPLPGTGGNSVIVGHRDTHFAVLQNLKSGDEILVETPNKHLRYIVFDTFIVKQNQTEVMHDYGFELLTLITCYPFHAIYAGGAYRFVVQAQLDSATLISDTGTVD